MKKRFFILLTALVTTVSVGCTNNNQPREDKNPGVEDNTTDNGKDDDEEKMDEFNTLIEKNKDLRDKGYKVQTSEGMYYPVIDYEVYEDYKKYVGDEAEDYLEIKVTESKNLMAKDAALLISWKELVTRALNQEEFIEKYPGSSKLKDIKDLYANYVHFIFFGLDNTPLFSYEDKTMNKDAKQDYSKIVDKKEESELLSNLKEFLDLVEKNDDKLAEEVENYRQNIVDSVNKEN